MTQEEKWIDVPILLNHEQCLSIKKHFARFGINHKFKPANTRIGTDGANHAYSVFVTEAHAPTSALVLRHYFDIQDPATEQPLTGACPTCGEEVTKAWVCPSCEISFRGAFDREDPMVVFIRQYSGFDES